MSIVSPAFAFPVPAEPLVLCAARVLAAQLGADEPISRSALNAVMATHLGGSDAAGRWSVRDAHAAGLAVHVWTLRGENRFLPAALQRGSDPAAIGDLPAEVRAFVAAGVDGLFCDQPAPAREALQAIAELN